MNNFTKKLSWLIMSMMLLVSGSVWADDITFTPGTVNGTTTDQTADEMTSGGITISCTSAALGRTDNYRFYANSTTTVSSSVGNITKVVFTCSTTDYASTLKGAKFSEGEATKNDVVVTWTGNAQSFTFKPAFQVRVDNIVVTIDDSSTPIVNKPEAPTFTPEEGVFTEAQSITISCTTTGASIYYTTDGNDPTTSSTKYTGAITISKTTTLKAFAFKGTESSSIVSATYTIVSPITIAEARAQETGYVFTSGVVTSISTNTSGTTAYIQDGTAGICVYGTAPAGILVDDNKTLTIGDKITVVGTLTDYKGLLEIKDPTSCTIVSSGNEVTPAVKTINEIKSDNTLQGILVKIENATVTAINNANTTISQGEGNTIVVRGISGVTLHVNDVISLTGNVSCYDQVQIANPTDVEVSQAPNISLSTNAIDVPHNGGEGTIEVTFTAFEPFSTDLYFYESDGVTDAECEWVYAEINADGNVYYKIDANTGEARTAYFKVCGFDENENELYSELITVTQAAFVLDYATLPFEFDKGKSSIESTAGLIENGLGGDYNSSPKLKFDGTGDWLILQFNERPGILTFDIKGNGFSEGTFTVQTSKDGVNYTELESYAELGTTQHEKFEDLDENVRYIKWIYTEKVNGNVALGNIQLTKYVESQPYTLTIAPDEHAEIFVFYSSDFTEIASSDDVLSNDNVLSNKEIFISASAKEGYVLQSITVTDENGENITLNDVEGEEGISWTFIMPASNVTVSSTCTKEEPFEPTTYTLVTSADELSAGDEIIIVNVEAGVALSTEQKPNNRGEVAITIDESDKSTVVITQKEVQVLTLEASDDNWLFNAGNGYLYAASSGSNYLRTEDEPDSNGNAEASIEISDKGDATITFKGTNTRNTLRYNSTSQLFSCYASSSSTGVPVQIYKKVSSDVKYGDANGDGSVDISDVVVIVNYILNSGSVSGKFVFENADVNNDGAVDISDVVGVVNLILNGE